MKTLYYLVSQVSVSCFENIFTGKQDKTLLWCNTGICNGTIKLILCPNSTFLRIFLYQLAFLWVICETILPKG